MRCIFSYVFILLSLLSWTRAQISLQVNDENTEFQISYNDVLLFSHDKENTVVSLGYGEAEFVNTAGNFQINDTVTETVQLPLFVVYDDSAQNVSLSLFTSDSNYEVRLELLEVADDVSGGTFLQFRVASVSPDETFNRIFLNFVGEQNEKIFGAGEQYTYFNLKGHNFPIWTREQGVGRYEFINDSGVVEGAVGSYHTTYWPQASYLSSKKYSLLLSNYEYLELQFEEEERNVIYSHSVSLSGIVVTSSTIRDLIPKVSYLVGRQPTLPDWIMSGAVLAFENGSEEMMLHYNECKDAGVDISGLWIQDWSGTTETNFGHRVYWNWKWNETYYEDFDDLIEQLAAENVKMMVYCNCHLITGSEMFEEADRNGYFLKNSTNQTFLLNFGDFFGGTIDVFSEEARNWYADSLRKNMIDLGIKGWMADFGEYTDLEMLSAEGIEPETLHNQYPVFWAETNKKIVEDADDSEVVYFMRSGGLGSSGNQILTWAGDQNVDFSMTDGVATTIVAALSLAVSGMGVTHFDIGGFTTQSPVLKRTEELLLRSAEYAVFTPVMRTHLGNKPDQNVQIYDSPEILSSFARLTKIHTRLFNYTKDIVRQNSDDGVPVQRPMFFHYENDPGTWDLQYQYMYGPDLIVAPVIHKDQVEVSLYIPEGDDAKWIHLWDGYGEEHSGPDELMVSSPRGFPAVLYRSGSNYTELFESIREDFGPVSPLYITAN